MVMIKPEAGMKDSGVKYIGLIPRTWKIVQLKYCTDCLDGKRIPIDASLRKSGIYPYWGAGRIMDYVDDYIFDERLVLLGEDGAPFFDDFRPVSHSIDGKVWVNNHIHVLRTKDNVVDSYLVHALNSVDYHEYINGSILNKLTQSNMNRIKIPLPSYIEQQAIGDYLDETCSKIDEIIAEAKASIDEYKKLRQGVIFEAVTKGLDKNVEMKAINLEYLDSCPADWNILPVSILFDFFGGFAYKSDRFCEETNNQVIRLGNVKDDELRLNSNPVYVSDEYANDSSKAAIKVDDILFTMTGTRGKGDYFYTLIITEDDLKEKNLFLNQRVGCFRKAYHTVYMPYYNYLLKSPKIRERVFLYETGTANQGNIGIESINRIRLYNPPMEVQKNIVRILDQKCSTIDSLITEKGSLINDLEAYKKSLIYEVVTGKRRVV